MERNDGEGEQELHKKTGSQGFVGKGKIFFTNFRSGTPSRQYILALSPVSLSIYIISPPCPLYTQSSNVTWRRAGVPDQKFVKKLYLSQRSLDFQSFWYLLLGMPIFAIIRRNYTGASGKNSEHWRCLWYLKTEYDGAMTRGAGNLFQYFTTRRESTTLLHGRRLGPCSYM